jgi:hypothetical protein
MLLSDLDAFSKNDRHIKEFSTIATVCAATWAAALSTALACSKGAGSGRGKLPIANAGFSVE